MDLAGGERTPDYAAKQVELKHSEILLPESAPDWAQEAFGLPAFEEACADILSESEDPGVAVIDTEVVRAAWAKLSEQLWTSVEDGEERLNKHKSKAWLTRSVTLAIPNMLSREHQIELVQNYIRAAFTAQGMVADWVLHDTGTDNPHAHILLTLRTLDDEDWSRKKAIQWDTKAALREWRALWSQHANRMLEREGLEERIDHRTLKEQQIELGAEPLIEPENWTLRPSNASLANGD